MDWSEAGRDDGAPSRCSVSSSSYDTAGSTHVPSVGSSFASIDHHHDAAFEPRTTTKTVTKTVTKTSDDPSVGRNPSSSRLGRGLDGSGSALAALQDAIASGMIDPPAPPTTSRPRRRSEPEPMHLQSLLFSTMRPRDDAADDADDDDEKPETKRRSVDEQEFADRMGIPPASNPRGATVTRQKTPRGLPVMTQLVDRRALAGEILWGEWLSRDKSPGAGAFDSFPDELPSASPRGSGEWRRRRSFSAGDMELRAAAMAAVKSVREDQARSRVGSPVA